MINHNDNTKQEMLPHSEKYGGNTLAHISVLTSVVGTMIESLIRNNIVNNLVFR